MPEVVLFPNSSIAGICWAAILLFIIPFIVRKQGTVLVIILIVTALLPAIYVAGSDSRAGWLGLATGLSYIIWLHLHRKWRKLFLAAATIFLSLFFLLLFFYKADSSSGRKHIYQLSATMLRDNWLYGIGLNKFKARFNEYQADYFSAHDIDSQRAFLADNTFYAFNEYLQWVIETGLAGLILLLTVIYLMVRRISFFHRNGSPAPVTVVAATASLLCVAVAALFSYPLHCVPVQAILLACTGIIVFYRLLHSNTSVKQRVASVSLKVMVAALLVLFVRNLIQEHSRTQMEKEAFELARSGYKTAAVARYQQQAEKYPDAGHNWFLYAQQLYYSNQLPKSMKVLKQGMMYYVDNKMYKLKADIELEIGMYEMAEQSYLRAIYMVPNRMGSRLDLLNFYLNRKDTTKAIYWAGSILNMRIKIPSDKVEKMLLQVQGINKRLKEEAVSGKRN